MDECIFCRIVARTAPSDVIAEDDEVIVFLSLEDHPLVVPKAHVPDIFGLSDALGAALMRQTIRVAKAVKVGLACDGVYLTQVNGAAAGQDVFHFHLHVYPRWQGRPGGRAGHDRPPGPLCRADTLARITEALPTH